jgi:large subunit ribosomal protein L5
MSADTNKPESEAKPAKPPKGEGKAEGGARSGAAKGGAAGKPAGKGRGRPEEPKKAGKKGDAKIDAAPANLLKEHYQKEVVAQLMKRFSFTSFMQVPRMEKVVVNMGVGDALQNIKLLDAAVADLETITGQRPAIRRAKKSIANFKLRTGAPIGCMVTLRGARMWEFLERLMTVAIPRVRDFRGLSPRSFDGHGNYTFGIKEQVIFPEIQYDKVEKIRGMDVTLVTTAATDEEGYELLKGLRWPFRER